YRRSGRGLAALKAADMTVAYSSSVERHLAANGVTRRWRVPLFTTTTPKLGSGHSSRRRVVFAGRVVAAKGLDTLIRAVREVEGEFVICGDGWQLESMRQLARRLGLQERIRFKGWLPAELLAEELAEASVVVVPSLWPEPFGLVGIEAFSAGRPVIASATGGIGDWLEDGVSGLSFPAGDASALARALNELLADPERQSAMGMAGQKVVAARFSAKRHVEALLDAYRSARSARRPDPDSGGGPATTHTQTTTSSSRPRTAAAVRAGPICCSANARPRLPSASRRPSSASSDAIPSARPLDVGSTTSTASWRTSSDQRRGPSSAITGAPDASDPASVPLREDGPPAPMNSRASQPASASESSCGSSVPLKESESASPRARAPATHDSAAGEDGPGAPSSSSSTSTPRSSSARSASSTSALAAPS